MRITSEHLHIFMCRSAVHNRDLLCYPDHSSWGRRNKQKETSALQDAIVRKSRRNDYHELPSTQRVPEEVEKPRFCPTGYPDQSVYGSVLENNGVAVFLKRSAMHAQVGLITSAKV